MNPHTLALIQQAKLRHAERLAAKALLASPDSHAAKLPAQTDMMLAASSMASNIVDTSNLPMSLSNTTTHAQTSRMEFNAEQLAAIELGLQAKSFCLIGAAGTGKTTVTQELITRLQQASHMLPLSAATKHLAKEAPGIVICGFTNKAVNNIRKKLPKHLQGHCMTIHKLLEYQPVYYEVTGENGLPRTTMRFEPGMNAANPLPHISTIIFEESSMIGTDLYGEVIDALPRASATQIIFLGDLNQIPPVFGPSILGFKLAELPTVELVRVYRQALASPIISLATAVRLNSAADMSETSIAWQALCSNSTLTETLTEDNGEHGKVTIKPWKKRVGQENAIAMMKIFLPRIIESGEYDPEADMILCPFNKSFGTIELNNIIADFLSKRRGAEVFEVIARYQKSYWAVGDRVLVDRHEAVITKIESTIGYAGKLPRMSSLTLDRWGYDPESDTPSHEMSADDILNALDNLAADDEGKNLASHTITVHIADLDETRRINTAGEINSMLFGYALTIHKSQGSEWQRVFLMLHSSHATMLSRELVYTAVTRAKHELYIICEGDIKPYENSIKRAASKPIIPGTQLAEKIEFFRGKKQAMSSFADAN
jgi:exodeoxyribonuclease V alpha subunit